MENRDFLEYQIGTSGRQVEMVLDGFAAEKWDKSLSEGSMNTTELVGHLTECYLAVQKHMLGEEHEWGSYIPAQESAQELVAAMRTEREKAKEALLAASSDDAVKAATDYVVLHDVYHVGQMAALRMSVDPEWDAYSIYK